MNKTTLMLMISTDDNVFKDFQALTGLVLKSTEDYHTALMMMADVGSGVCLRKARDEDALEARSFITELYDTFYEIQHTNPKKSISVRIKH